ncbi:DUF2063 domain-containing protein [Vibrio sp. JPW-9-11-11]|uniref:HvfC/BufC N-terminal domain-containing protein n=1 Tax=Vibrio sp. JPW-9-11-11 TaxID=1416532 RepID=UPI0015933EF0|nr:DNA-binding domain-containing protein [Vibrio sp. JPW-9-11-11]NVD08122.1 DUF2063 domain-containing protein [Vibrio sp. JPW-9-11-11]
MSVSPSLAQLQSNFNAALHYQANAEQCDIVSDAFSAEERLQIYRNNFIISLSEVLQATYPMLLALWGEECFAQVARQHVLHHPLTSGDVSHYGNHFSDTINQFPALVDAAPYSPDVARFEWVMDQSVQQYNHSPTLNGLRPLEGLSQISTAEHCQIKVHLHPSVMGFASSYALFSLRQAIQENDFSSLDLNQAEQGVIAYQAHQGVWSMALTENEYSLLKQLQAQHLLSDIAPSLLTHLNRLNQLKLLAGFTLEP